VRETTATGREALDLTTLLLQRARRADPVAGVWEAADVQWWSRRPMPSEAAAKPFWLDDEGPVAGVVLTAWGDEGWQVDPVLVPGAEVDLGTVWARALEAARRHSPGAFEVPVDDADTAAVALAEDAGLVPGERDATGWLDVADRLPVVPLPDGFRLVDRAGRDDVPHPMRHRNGDDVAARLAGLSLYDPAFDLAVETDDGRVAGYTLFWPDPTTGVGLVEPVRVEDEFARRGLARAMLTAGIDRLTARGMRRVKVSYGSKAAGALYRGVGFVPTSTSTWWACPADES
jgi:predicted N-acetyltransferase YhbS